MGHVGFFSLATVEWFHFTNTNYFAFSGEPKSEETIQDATHVSVSPSYLFLVSLHSSSSFFGIAAPKVYGVVTPVWLFSYQSAVRLSEEGYLSSVPS